MDDEKTVGNELWSVGEVARFLKLSVREVEVLRQEGRLSATKRWPRGWRFSSASVIGYFEGQEPSPAEPQHAPENTGQSNFGEILKAIKELEQRQLAEEGESEGADYDAPSMIKMVNAIFSKAIDLGASDVHFEPSQRLMRVRFRINGLLQEVLPIPKLLQDQLVRRVMVMAELDLARLFVPQVGMIRVKHNTLDWGVRVTVIASLYGHTITARLVNQALLDGGLQELGMLPELLVPLEDQLDSAGGLFLFAGPSGSGTTTTAATCLRYLNKIECAVYTIEQPIEYELLGATQIQLNPFCGHTLEKALKTVLRSQPQVLFLGSIENAETARAALEAAEAGITVLATVRCTSIATVFTLLERYGIAPQTQARLIQAVLNQRLVHPPRTEAVRGFFEVAWIGGALELQDLIEQRAPHEKLEKAIRRYAFSPPLEEQLAAGEYPANH
ncbi:ATPase, T2SS/T4P/T4SS family [Armatimonas sp.]|uniref:ATPase, T2SS/T4P/T4SS family n=1 Tax=Armatimonas sp. TaxID=1872638 RepID=UPI0037538105